ncbi:glycosyltransferase family 1 protein [uncultured Polaribacter sp.]|uniref:glycosyltransferase family 4 protein n=1 Tax=uncultured Polaribacter sp. TaxID=174711 RepID=UPI002619B26D|nr:glycosyltransferase family 1 protein [uncultured Polaribacter sp.]
MKKKKIVVDARMINDSGIGTYLKNVIPYLIPKYDLVLLGNQKHLYKYENKLRNNIVKFTANIYSFEEQIYLPLVIPKCDIFWSPHINVPILPIRAIKQVTTIHDINLLAFNNNFSILKKMYAKLLYKNAVKKSHQIITVSNFSKSEILKYLKVDEKKINVIYGGVNKLFFKKSTLNFELPKNYLLYVGNVKPHKNLITLLKSYNKLPLDIKKVFSLVVIGKKEGFITPDKKVFNFIDKNNLINNVIFTGYVEDKYLPYIYQKAKMFVFPSLYEGFGLPILEAMASKTLVLSSNLTSLPEVSLNNALYFNPLNIEELKDLIVNEIYNDNNKKIELAYNHSKKFTWQKSAEDHIKIFEKVI